VNIDGARITEEDSRMTHCIVPAVRAAIEAHDIHAAACRYRRQGLVCSTCADLAERADRAIRRVVAVVEAA
jgi:hypothetical protein